jgi:hypothetical protein
MGLRACKLSNGGRARLADRSVGRPRRDVCGSPRFPGVAPHSYRSAVTGPAERPLLFLDVDGPLIPFGPRSRRPHSAPADGSEAPSASGNPLLERLDPAVGPRLTALGCDLVWASTWMDDANETVAPLIGLPQLPVLDWPEVCDGESPRGLHWKTRRIVAWAGQRSFIWVDDEISEMDRLWVSAQHEGRSLLHRVDPYEALTDDDFAELARWLRRNLPDFPSTPR